MKRIICILLCITLCAGILLIGYTAHFGTKELTVAIYPYIPNRELFCSILTQHWAKLEPNVSLNYVNWDCYSNTPPEDIDIIMYDAIFGQQIVQDGYIQPIVQDDIENLDGLLPFSLEGAIYNGDYYGIPFLVCSDFLIYYKDDTEAAAAKNFADLCAIVQPQANADENQGISTDYANNFPYSYLDALIDYTGTYSDFEEIPEFDPAVMSFFEKFKQTLIPAPEGETADALGTFYRAYLFNQGIGRVHYGYSEDMALMTDIQDEIALKAISFLDDENIPLFFADIVSMTSQVNTLEKKDLCIKLMNLVASEEFLQEACFGTEEPQYMLPARMNLYSLAAKKYPLYAQLEKLVLNENNKLFLFGPDVHEYLAEAYMLAD